MTAASGLYNVVRQVLGSVGIAVAATELVRSQSRYHDVLAEHVTLVRRRDPGAGCARATAGMMQRRRRRGDRDRAGPARCSTSG